jgi:hypothetical protein
VAFEVMSAAVRDLFAGHWIASGAAFGHSVGIHGPGGATLRAIRISGARNGNGRLTGRRSWICGLGLAHSRLPILSVRFSYAGILRVGTCTEQHHCRRQTYYPFHRMPSFYNFTFNSERGKKCRSCVKFRAKAPLHKKEMHSGGRRGVCRPARLGAGGTGRLWPLPASSIAASGRMCP